jgi:hypothetical protein
MKTYVATDKLNPNAVNARYGRPASLCSQEKVAVHFSADSDEEAEEKFYQLIEDGWVGYSDKNTERVDARLYRAKEWYKKSSPKPLF